MGKRYDLWPRPYRLKGFATPEMRLSSDIRRCVIFLGHGLDGSFAPSGTGFFCAFDNARYLVTAKHVAAGFGDDPFSFRVNKLDGGSDTFDFDPLSDGIHHPWFSLDDPSVDVAVMPFNKDFRGAGYAAMLLPDSFITQPNLEIGIGDTCYAVGLFRLLAGSKRNVPIVHTGNIALMPGDEGILVNDWRDETGRSTIESEAYLVEVANLPGLSGAPVFVRPTSYIDLGTIMEPRDRDHAYGVTDAQISLLGIWCGSWDGMAQIAVEPSGTRGLRVPVGMGVVTPAAKLLELLQSEPVRKERDAWHSQLAAMQAAQLDAQPTS